MGGGDFQSHGADSGVFTSTSRPTPPSQGEMLRKGFKDLKPQRHESVGFQLSPWGVFKATFASRLGPVLLLVCEGWGRAAQMAEFTHSFFYFNKLVVTQSQKNIGTHYTPPPNAID